MAPGRERVKIVGTIDRDDVDEDEDEDLNEVCYFIVNSDGPKGLFAIHPTNHELMTTDKLDRESRTNYNIMIKATEDCLDNIIEEDAFNDTIQDSSMLKIKVNVLDVDDNPPEFIQRTFTGRASNSDIEFQN